jgi:hypothetical protein
MKRADFHGHVGERNICDNIEHAIRRAEEIHATPARVSA